MKCLRCGYCCVQYDVIIVDDPNLGIPRDVSSTNFRHKPTGQRCQHLRGDQMGRLSCAVHNYPWFEETPCHSHRQVEDKPSTECRMGRFQLKTPSIVIPVEK